MKYLVLFVSLFISSAQASTVCKKAVDRELFYLRMGTFDAPATYVKKTEETNKIRFDVDTYSSEWGPLQNQYVVYNGEYYTQKPGENVKRNSARISASHLVLSRAQEVKTIYLKEDCSIEKIEIDRVGVGHEITTADKNICKDVLSFIDQRKVNEMSSHFKLSNTQSSDLAFLCMEYFDR